MRKVYREGAEWTGTLEPWPARLACQSKGGPWESPGMTLTPKHDIL